MNTIEQRIEFLKRSGVKELIDEHTAYGAQIEKAEQAVDEARAILKGAEELLELEEARLVPTIEGGNAETRRAALAQTKKDDTGYQTQLRAVQLAEGELAVTKRDLNALMRQHSAIGLRLRLKDAQLRFLAGGNEQ